MTLRCPRTARWALPSCANQILLACFRRAVQADGMIKIKILFVAALSLGMAGFCFAQTSPSSTSSPSITTSTAVIRGSSAPYTEGPVWTITMVKTKAGMGDDYFKQISQSVKPVYDEEKKQRIILDYKILDGDAAGAQDFNILIMVEYPNMAALDGLRDKMDPIVEKVMGSEDQRRATAVKRLDIREILGTKTMREITLK
jgi:hypothetical protein